MRGLADERQFYAGGTTPGTDRPLPVDARRGQDAGNKALALAEELTEELKQLSLPDERTKFDKQLHERVNRSLVVSHLLDLAVKGLPWALLHFARAFVGCIAFTLTGRYESNTKNGRRHRG